MSSLRRILLFSVSIFTLLSIYMIIQNEQKFIIQPINNNQNNQNNNQNNQYLRTGINTNIKDNPGFNSYNSSFKYFNTIKPKPFEKNNNNNNNNKNNNNQIKQPNKDQKEDINENKNENEIIEEEIVEENIEEEIVEIEDGTEKRGLLYCNKKRVDSEIIYWKRVPGDSQYESPITPHHGIHHDKYITYEYDEGGWNNIRMGMECLIVLAHAMGRTLIIPPQQNLYLLNKGHIEESGKEKRQMGFEDFFDLSLLKTQNGFHMLTTSEFLKLEGLTGGLKGIYPPNNKTELWGRELTSYLRKVADKLPQWSGKFVVMPNATLDMATFNENHFNLLEESTQNRLKLFGGERKAVFYDKDLQDAHHIHFEAGPSSRILQHHYAFAFFVDKEMQSFYRRFVRDYMRYKDYIQCAGKNVLEEVRKDAFALSNGNNSDFYALHIRRGDFQFKEVKLSASEILQNLVVNGKPLIPPGSLVYISTDDPKGICENCLVQRIPCDKYEKGKKPPGCPEDPSWNAFTKFGWKLRFLDDYIAKGVLNGVNPNIFGMVESIVCSRAKVFAGTFFSTFTGYIHRLRGYHGLGEDTYYHSTGRVTFLQMKKSVGHGFSREWRAGWTDDGGELI